MKLLSAIIGSACLAIAPLRAGIFTGIEVRDYYQQISGDSLIRPFGTVVSAFVLTWPDNGIGQSADSVAFLRPDGTPMALTTFFADDQGLIGIWNDVYPSVSAIPGGNYIAHFVGGTLDGLQLTFGVDPGLMPPPIPKLTKRSFELLSSGDVTQPIRLVFQPWVCPRAAGSANTALFIADVNGTQVEHVQVDPRTASIVIPANTLKPGHQYGLTLMYRVESAQDTQESYVSYSSTNSFNFTTASAASTHVTVPASN